MNDLQFMPHQEEVLNLTDDKNRCAYYLDMGLGKTFVGAEKMYLLNNTINLIVCQKSKIDDWVDHIKTYYPEYRVMDLTKKSEGVNFRTLVETKDLYDRNIQIVGVINYDLVFRRKYIAHITDFTLLLDESSLICNENAKRSKFILKLQPESVILLSGTPTAGKYERFSNLKAVKDLIDDYDLMASSLSNNLIDFDHPLYAVKGFEGDNLDELQQNLKTKKIVGVGSDGGIEVHTVDVPYEARKVKLELDEKNIYRFGMGLNLSGLKDTSATTNIAIKAAYSLLDLRCKHLERNIKRFLRKIVAVCIDEINQQNGTDYQITDVYFEFTHEVMSNEQENEQNELTEAQKQQVQINTLLSLAQIFGDDLTIQYICDVLDIDYEDVKDKLPDNEADKVQQVQDDLDSIIPDDVNWIM